MSFGEIQLKRIQDKLQLLIKEHAAVQKENSQLKEQIEKSSEMREQLQKSIDDLKLQVSVLQLNSGEMTEIDKKEFEKKINGYIREIDRCISLLSE